MARWNEPLANQDEGGTKTFAPEHRRTVLDNASWRLLESLPADRLDIKSLGVGSFAVSTAAWGQHVDPEGQHV